MLDKKIYKAQELIPQLNIWHFKGMKVGFTNGCFDVLHMGHVHLFVQAKTHCDKLIVGLNSDDSIKRLKGSERPFHQLAARQYVLSALSPIDAIVAFEEDTPINLIQTFKPDYLFKGGDWKDDQIVGSDLVKKAGGKVMIIPFLDGFSTTRILNKATD